MIKAITTVLFGLLMVVLMIGCSTLPVDEASQAANSQPVEVPVRLGHFETDHQQQRWEIKLPVGTQWQLATKDLAGDMNSYTYLPRKQNLHNWHQNITEKFIAQKRLHGRSLSDMMKNAQHSAKSSCQTVHWQVFTKNDKKVIYRADSIACGHEPKQYSQHVVGRLDRGDDGIYSLQYFITDDMDNKDFEEKMVNIVSTATLITEKKA